MSRRVGVLLAVSLLALCHAVSAAVHKYNGAKFVHISDAFLFTGGREGLFASSVDAVEHWMHVAKGVANGKSYIR